MAQSNDIAAAIWKTGESIPVVGTLFTGLEKIGNIPVIKGIGDAIGDLINGKPKPKPTPQEIALASAQTTGNWSDPLLAPILAARGLQTNSDGTVSAKLTGNEQYAIDYGMTAPDARGIMKPLNVLGGVSINGKIVSLPTDIRQLGLTQNYPGLGAQIIANVRNGAPAGTGISAGNAGATGMTGAADVAGSIGGGNNKTTIIIVAIVVIILTALLITRSK